MVNITGWLTVWNIFQMKRLRKLGLFSLENSEDIMGKNGDEGSRLFSEVPCDRTRGNQHKLKEIEFNLNTKKKNAFLLWEMGSNTGTGCPETLWSLGLWRSSKATWKWSWAPCSGCPYFSRGWTRWTYRSLSISTYLWFCAFKFT